QEVREQLAHGHLDLVRLSVDRAADPPPACVQLHHPPPPRAAATALRVSSFARCRRNSAEAWMSGSGARPRSSSASAASPSPPSSPLTSWTCGRAPTPV